MVKILRIVVIFSIFFLLSAFGDGIGLFTPDKNLWQKWVTHNPMSEETVDHSLWNGFLKKHLIITKDDVSRIDYANIPPESQIQLIKYIKDLQKIKIRKYNRSEQLAFWSNLYNAMTIKIVLDHYPVETIKDISLGLFSIGPWSDEIIQLEDSKISLNDIEHRILRPIWNEPRIHYILNCASVGCPSLQPRAITAGNSEDYLNSGAKLFINSSQGVDVNDKDLGVSKIYDWFIGDFGGDAQSVLRHIRSYAEPKLAAKLEHKNKINFSFYDWNLNDIKINEK